jgi:hypothetical protein
VVQSLALREERCSDDSSTLEREREEIVAVIYMLLVSVYAEEADAYTAMEAAKTRL